MEKQIEKEKKVGTMYAQRKAYRGHHRGDDDEAEEGKVDDFISKKRNMEEYLQIVAKNTQFFSTYDAEDLLATLADYAEA